MMNILHNWHRAIAYSATVLFLLLSVIPVTQAAIVFTNDIFEGQPELLLIDADGTATSDIVVQFGAVINETLRWDYSDNRFIFSDDLEVDGDVFVDGVDLVLDADNTGPGQNVQIVANQGADADGILRYNATTDRWEISNDGGATYNAVSTGTGSGGYAQTITVAKSGGDFTSVKAAVDSITDNTSTKRYVVLVYAGTYNEDPFVMKEYVDLIGVGGSKATRLVANNASANFITSADQSIISGFSISGVTTGACIYINNVPHAHVNEVHMEACQYGMRVIGSATQAIFNLLYAHGGPANTVVSVENGADVYVTGGLIDNSNLTNAFSAVDPGTRLTVTSTLIRDVENAMYVNNDASLHSTGVQIENVEYALRVGPTGTDSHIQSSGGDITDSVVYDIYVEATSGTVIVGGGTVNRNKVRIPATVKVSAIFSDETSGDEGTVNLGNFAVGNIENPSATYMGEGIEYTDRMLVYTFNGSTYTNQFSAAQAADGTTFALPGTGVNNAILFSSDRMTPSGTYAKIGGFSYKTGATALNRGTGNIVYEYWNGSTWEAFSIFCQQEELYYRYSNRCMERANSEEALRFAPRILSNWVANDPVGLGSNRFWVRARVATAITTAPVIDQIKMHPSMVEVQPDGNVTFYGRARDRRTFVTSLPSVFFGTGSNSPDANSFTVGTGVSWTDERNAAAFDGNNLLEETTGSVALPKGLDTSGAVRVKVFWKKVNNNTGNVQWKLSYLTAGAKNVLAVDGSNIVTAPRTTGEAINTITGVTIETSPEGSGSTQNEIIVSEFPANIDVSGYYEGDLLFLRLFRDPADPDDTYVSDAVVVGIEISGAFWRHGENQ